jgi:hypothetical protein
VAQRIFGDLGRTGRWLADSSPNRQNTTAAAEMARHQNELQTLLKVRRVDLEPSCIAATHVCGNDARRNYRAGQTLLPLDPFGPTFPPGRINPRRASRTKSSFSPSFLASFPIISLLEQIPPDTGQRV